MQIDEKFFELISINNELNKTQIKMLDFLDNEDNNFKELSIGKEISRNDANMLMLLKGKLAVKAQEQIVKNYHMVLDFNNIKTKTTIDNTTNKTTSSKPDTSINKSDDDSNIKIYCDGACSGNPGKAGSGLALYIDNKLPILYHGAYVENGTNNIAELNALYKALLLSAEIQSSQIITILSDSKYSIDCIKTWAYGWKAKGWTKKGGEIKNLELIKAAHLLYEKIKNKIEIKHVKGHAGIEGNELADRMAVHTIKAKNENYESFSYSNVNDVLNLTSY